MGGGGVFPGNCRLHGDMDVDHLIIFPAVLKLAMSIAHTCSHLSK